MKPNFQMTVRGLLVALICFIGWTVWAETQTNGEPAVKIVSPLSDTKFRDGTNVVLTLAVSTNAGAVQRIEFFDGSKSVPVVSNSPTSFTWASPGQGRHVISAKLILDDNSSVTSAPIRIRVNNADLTFGLDKVEALSHTFGGIPLWQYCASLLYIFLAFYISKFADYAIRVWLKRLTQKTDTKLDDLLLELLHGPVKIISFVVFLFIGLDLFDWPPMVENIMDKVFRLIVAFSVTYTFLKGVDMLMGYWKEVSSEKEDRGLDQHLFPIVRKILKAFVFVVAVLVTWQNLSEKPITAILASLSVAGLAIGLAAQDTVANFFGAVVVFIDKPFRIGDRIKLSEVDGVVEDIGLRSTRVRSLDGFLITVPNKTMGNATITNISRRLTIKTEMNFGVTYDTSMEKLNRALEILREVYGQHPKTHDLIITFNRFADSSLNIQVVHWWKDNAAREQLSGMQEMNLEVKKRFDAEAINFAFPSQTVYLKQDSEWRVAEVKK